MDPNDPQSVWNAIAYAQGPWLDLMQAYLWGYCFVRAWQILARLFRLRWHS
jgi:hypothetical protein